MSVPAAATIPQGTTQAFAVLHAYNHGIVRDATQWSTWTSSDPVVAQVVAKGRLTGLASGTATITARISDINRSATATVTVTTPVLTSLTLAPLVPHRLVAAAVPFQVTGTYSDGTTQDLTGGVTWTSSQGTVATITSPGGLATALTPGLTTITAVHPDGLAVSTPLVVQRVPTTLDAVIPAQGRIGTPVTLLGANLGATNQVLFNGTAAAFTVLSATRITATVPGGAASGVVTVVTPDGPALSPVSFTVVPPPTISIAYPPDGATLVGDRVLVRGTILGGGTDLGIAVNGIPAQVNASQ